MKIISLNVNGIRSAARYGFFEWLLTENPDIICLQEVKALPEQLLGEHFCPQGYECFFHPAEKKGYSGVALYSRIKPLHVQIGMGVEWIDSEGRYLRADYPNLSIVSLYLPSGSSGEHRQIVKYQMMDVFWQHLQKIKNEVTNLIICGDWNIAHQNIDIKNWRSNQKNSGFLPEERAWLDQVLSENQFVDAFRVLNQESEQYTWWSNRGQAYAKNVGWRIDYHMISSQLKSKVKSVKIYKEQKFSDHAPLIIEYDIPFDY